ncbi:MAG: hypothetical protein HPY85_06390 [Anaerolineae bacterium]|nr:hypothetical protein [Anaerolineae bacterium]
MNRHHKLFAILGVILFSLGILIGMAFLAITTWGNLEAVGFYPSTTAEGKLNSVRCPVFLTLDETATISARFHNETENTIRPTVSTILSRGFITYTEEFRETIQLEPGDSYVMRWDINHDDAVYKMFVMARVVLLNSYPLEDLQAVCAVYVLNTTFLDGSAILILSLVSYAVLVGGGVVLWKKFSLYGPEANKHATRGILVLMTVVTTGIIANLFRSWILGGLAFTAGLLMIVSSLTLIVYTSKKP